MASSSTRPLVIINSGAYIHQELSAEFGELPPSFLPVGLKRLYERQSEFFSSFDCDLYLTLPESYELSEWDRKKLDAAGFSIIRTPDYLQLGEATLFALARIGLDDRPLRLLHGDTLLEGFDVTRDDVAAVDAAEEGYRWAVVLVKDGFIEEVRKAVRGAGREAPGGMPRLCGYFSFASARNFAEHLILARGVFLDALTSYAKVRPFAPLIAERWLDFGHLRTYFASRRIVTTQRAFNALQFNNAYVRKRSETATHKLRAEANWLTNVPADIKPFCARLLEEGVDERGYFYDTEYQYMPTLSELYVFGALAPTAWLRIFGACGRFLDTAVASPEAGIVEGTLHSLAIDKTCQRLDMLAQETGIDLSAPNRLNGRPAPSLLQCIDGLRSILKGCGDIPTVMHGDFCFSNILFSFRSDRIQLIDPRGLTEQGEFTTHGDVRYDIAKFMHSITGRYDLIIAGMATGGRNGQDFELDFAEDKNRIRLETVARELVIGGVPLKSDIISAVTIALFLSMGPLHADRPDRQAAFVGNALRLYMDMDGDKS